MTKPAGAASGVGVGSLGGSSLPTIPFSVSGAVTSIPDLVARRTPAERARVRALAGYALAEPIEKVLARLPHLSDPVALWAVHLALERRGLPPCQRWPAIDATPQHEFVTFCADLHWLAKMLPGHVPAHRGWRGVFDAPLGSGAWHGTALRQYLFVAPRYSVAHWCARGLALSDAQRAPLMMLPTTKMRADRRGLDEYGFQTTRDALLADATVHPDRSRATTPASVAERRAALWRVFVLSQRNVSETARVWSIVTGQTITRQAVAKQIEAVNRALRRRRENQH